MLGFNDTSTLEGHFVSSPREREKRDRRDIEEIKERDREERGTGMVDTCTYNLATLFNCTPVSLGSGRIAAAPAVCFRSLTFERCIIRGSCKKNLSLGSDYFSATFYQTYF